MMEKKEKLFGIIGGDDLSPQPTCISIFSPAVARALLKLGHHIADIKPHKENKFRTVFLFEKTESLLHDLGALPGRSFHEPRKEGLGGKVQR